MTDWKQEKPGRWVCREGGAVLRMELRTFGFKAKRWAVEAQAEGETYIVGVPSSKQHAEELAQAWLLGFGARPGRASLHHGEAR